MSNTLPLWALIAEADRGTGAQIVTGIITVGGTLLGVVVGLFGERWVRTWGNVRCDLIWQSTQNAGSPDSPGGVEVQERQLEATFLNHKDVPVTVWEMRVMFYKGGEEFVPEERPNLAYTGSRSRRGAFELMTLPSRIPAKRTIFVTPPLNMPDIMRTFEEADRIEFVAVIEGAGTISTRLDSWKTRPAQKERLLTRSRYYSPNVGE